MITHKTVAFCFNDVENGIPIVNVSRYNKQANDYRRGGPMCPPLLYTVAREHFFPTLVVVYMRRFWLKNFFLIFVYMK